MKTKSAIVLLLFLLGACPAMLARGAPNGPMSYLKQLKAQQKIERKQLKAQEKLWKKSLRGQQISHFEVLQMQHQFDNRENELRLHQKEELQRAKDQLTLWKGHGQHLWSGGTLIQ